MSSAFITYSNSKGFYINESFMQLTFHYIYDEAKKTEYLFSNKEELLEDLEISINGHRSSYLGLGWVDIFTETDEQTMIQVLQNVKVSLQNKGSNISVSELLSIPTEDHTLKYILDKKPFPTAELIRVIDALIQMLQGDWNSTDYDMDLNWRYS